MKLRPTLFWDVDSKDIDLKKHAQFVIGRVLDFGNLKEWKTIKDFYGLEQIKKAAQKHIFYDLRSANFWALILGLPFKKLKCKKKPLAKRLKTFSSY